MQELISAPWGSSTGEAQSPEKPELGKEKEALDQVCLTHHDSNESSPHTPHVEFKLSPRIPRAFSRKVSFTAQFWGCCYEPEIGPLSPSQIRSSTLHSHLSGLRMANMVQDQNILHGLRTSENWSRHRSRQDIQTSAQVIACAQKYD